VLRHALVCTAWCRDRREAFVRMLCWCDRTVWLTARLHVLCAQWDVPGMYRLMWGWLDVFDGGVFVGHEWHFRTGLDHMSCLMGMAFAAVSPHLSSWLEAWEKSSVPSWASAVVKTIVAGTLVVATLMWAVPFGNLPKTQYNLAHPFFVLLPITTYIVLRNISVTVRSYHVPIFAWLGTITLETYLMQVR
jgi:hypothetical protein